MVAEGSRKVSRSQVRSGHCALHRQLPAQGERPGGLWGTFVAAHPLAEVQGGHAAGDDLGYKAGKGGCKDGGLLCQGRRLQHDRGEETAQHVGDPLGVPVSAHRATTCQGG